MSTLLGVSHRRFIQTATTALLIAVGMLAPTTATGTAALEPKTIIVLQLNLCNGGAAPCYEEYNRDEAVPEAISKIAKMEPKPDVITLNEVCRKDVATIARSTGYQADHRNFFPALRRSDDGSTTNHKCTNAVGKRGERTGYKNEDYGIGFLVRNHGDQVRNLSRAYTAQDTRSSKEVRVMACAEYQELNVCTTHLVAKADKIALEQCKELREYAADHARRQPTVVGGDFNLKYNEGSPTNVQKCAPGGFFRKGDGNVQHVMASGHFEFVSRRIVQLDRTDHEGLAVTVRLK